MIIMHKNKENLLDLLNKKYEIGDQNISYDKKKEIWCLDLSPYNRKITLKVLSHVFDENDGFLFSYKEIAYYKGVIFNTSLQNLNSTYDDFMSHLKNDPYFFIIKTSRFEKTYNYALNIYYLKEEMPKHLLKLLDTHTIDDIGSC